MRLFKATYRDRKGRKRQAAKWYVEFKDHLDTVRRLPAFTDRKASDEFGRKLERLAACRASAAALDKDLNRWIETLSARTRDKLAKIGLLKSEQAGACKTLAEHLRDFEQALGAKGNTAQHVSLVAARARAVIEGCCFQYHADISPARVLVYLAKRREQGNSAQTSNFYLQAFKQFGKWLVEERCASESPVAHLKGLNVRTDRRHDRRALGLGEVNRLLTAARNGPTVRRMTGPDRAMLYQLALETGLRWNELASLTRRSFDLRDGQAAVSVDAQHAKNRQAVSLPLRRRTAGLLREYLADRLPQARAFPMPPDKIGAKMLRVDLKKAGIPYEDECGRFIDFHGLRHCFLSLLANSGVHPSVAQRLARHSDIRLTMNRYTHSALERQIDAVEALPDLGGESDAASATGTYGESVLAECLASSGGKRGTFRDGSGQSKVIISNAANHRKPLATTEKRRLCKGKNLEAAAGFEPANDGFANRCLRPLGYAAHFAANPTYPTGSRLSTGPDCPPSRREGRRGKGEGRDERQDASPLSLPLSPLNFCQRHVLLSQPQRDRCAGQASWEAVEDVWLRRPVRRCSRP